MAEDIQASMPTGPNGERFELKLGNRSVGITSKDILSIIIVILLGVFGYFMSHNVMEGQAKITAGQIEGFTAIAKVIEQNSAHQTQLLEKMNGNQTILLELVHTNRTQMTDELSKQNEQVSQQTTALKAAVDEQTREINRRLAVLNYNLAHEPNDRIPLELDAAPGVKR
jgi:hypothetical protein